MKAIIYTKYGSPNVLELKGIKPQVGRGGFGPGGAPHPIPAGTDGSPLRCRRAPRN